MTYPPAPWILRGNALNTLHPVDIEKVRPFVPSPLKIIPIVPGKTIGIIYLASYGTGSVLEYSELIVASALTRYRSKVGFWISHIYVDNPDSVAGGREIWGLPKEMAQFSWQENAVTVRQENQILCRLACGQPRWLWRQPGFIPALSLLDSQLLWFKGSITARFGITGGSLEVPEESPFASIGCGRGRLTFHYKNLKFIAHAPQVVQKIR